MAETRLVYVTAEYLDGIEMADVKLPDEYTGPTARRLPIEVLDAYEAAWAALYVAEKAVLEAWGEATDEPNQTTGTRKPTTRVHRTTEAAMARKPDHAAARREAQRIRDEYPQLIQPSETAYNLALAYLERDGQHKRVEMVDNRTALRRLRPSPEKR